MTLYVLRRLAGLVPVLLGVTILVFLMLRLAPGDPVLALLGDSAQGISKEALQELRETHGFNRNPVIQYFDYLAGVVRGDLGTSLRSGQAVTSEVLSRFPATLQLAGAAITIAVLLGLSLGVLAAVFRRTWIDHVAVVVALLGVSVPVFWSGLLLMLLFALRLQWLPASGYPITCAPRAPKASTPSPCCSNMPCATPCCR